VFVGSFHPRELPETMFEGLQVAIQRGVELELVIIGNKRNGGRALARLEAMPELSNRTTFTGWISDEQLAEHLGSASAFVLLRKDDRETRALFPTRLPEYLVTGNPVVLSAAGDLPIYLRHRESAWIIPPGDAPEALADAIVHLANNDDERQKIGRGGFDVARRMLSIQPLGERLYEFLGRVLSDRRGAVHQKVAAQITTHG
jgi:glycosyltransferase involved in cell wall biosynthesis